LCEISSALEYFADHLSTRLRVRFWIFGERMGGFEILKICLELGKLSLEMRDCG
jgi:hypothetical protein